MRRWIPPQPSSAAAPVIVNAWSGQTTGTLHSFTITVAPTAGSLLVLSLVDYGAAGYAADSIADNQSSSWTLISGADAGITTSIQMWYLKNCGSGITTVTCTLGASNTYAFGCVHEITGCSATAPFTSGEYVTHAYTLAEGNPQTPSLAFATGNSIIIAGVGNDDGTAVSINGTGTTGGTWGYYNSNSHYDGNAVETASYPNIIKSSAGSIVHGWGALGTKPAVTIAAAFHP